METNNKKEKEIRNIDNLTSEELETEVEEAEEIVTEEDGFNWLPLVIVAAVLAIVIFAIIIVIAMNSGKKETTQTEVTRVEESSEEVSIEETVEEQTEAETIVEIEESVVEEKEENTLEKRLTELGLEGICVVVWNESTETEHIIAEGENYSKNEGDRFFICTPSFMIGINSETNNGDELGMPTENYCEISFNESEEPNKVLLEISCENGEQAKIQFCLQDDMKEEQQTGIDWVMSLGYDSPKMVVYNDTTGLRKELEEGEEYQLSEGDVVAMYKPDHWYFESTNITDAKIEHGVNIIIFDWRNLTLSDKLDVEISVWDTTTDSIVALHVTLLPPTK